MSHEPLASASTESTAASVPSAEQRAAFLAEASKQLAGSLDYETTLANVARLAVPALGDWCAVDLIDRDGTIRRLAVAHQDPTKVALAHELNERYPPNPDAPSGLPAVLRGGRSLFYPEIPDEMLVAVARDEEHLRIARELGLKSALIVPLTARDRTFGAMTFVLAESDRRYTPADLALAEDLASRCALAVDNARLYRESQEAIQKRDEFLSVAAHELRTPLATLQAHAQLVLRRSQRDGAVAPALVLRALGAINEQSNKLASLISQLLDISRLEAGRLSLDRQKTDLRRLVEAVVAAAQARTNQHRISIDGPDELDAMVDPLRLEQVFANLLDNAIKYSPEGGPIEISLRTGDLVEIAVRDHGLGIPPEKRGQIFERFYQAHSENHASGMGLGLYISRQIVELHRGELRVEFPDDGGTRFVLRLPDGRSAPSIPQAG